MDAKGVMGTTREHREGVRMRERKWNAPQRVDQQINNKQKETHAIDEPLRSLETIALASRLRRDCASAATVACPVGPHAAESGSKKGRERERIWRVSWISVECVKYEIVTVYACQDVMSRWRVLQ